MILNKVNKTIELLRKLGNILPRWEGRCAGPPVTGIPFIDLANSRLPIQ